MIQLVSVTLGVDVPAYVNVTIEVPADVNLEGYLKEVAEQLCSDNVFEADWQEMNSLRVVTARDGVSGKVLAEDLGIEPRPYDRGLFASEVIKRNWETLVRCLPCDVLGQFAEVLEV